MYKHIAIEGNIGSGKTTLAIMLSEALSSICILENFEENPFLIKYYNDFEKYALHVELFFLITRLKQLKMFFSEIKFHGQTFFSDFIFEKTKIFAHTHLKGDLLTLFNNIFSELEQNCFLPDLVLYLHRPATELKSNIKKRGRAMESEIPNTYLQNLESSYRLSFENEKRFPIIWLNCNDIYYQPNDIIFYKIKDLLNQKWENGLNECNLI